MYNIIKELCTARGVSVTKMCKDCGLSPTVLSELKYGRTRELSAQSVRKIAEYFGVSPSQILNGEPEAKKEQPITNGDELIEILEACKERSDLRILFKLSKDATPDDVRKAIAIIEALKNV